MKTDITAERIANAIRMMKGKFALIVEGELDLRIYPFFFNSDQLQVHSSFGYERLIEAVDILNTEGNTKVLGIIDRDFREITNEVVGIENIFLTDYHDLETMIIASPTLDMFEELHIKDKGRAKEILSGYFLKDYIFRNACIIASFRYLNYIEKDKFGLRFNDLNYKKIINSSEEIIIDYILDCSRRKNAEFNMADKNEIVKEYKKINIKDFDELQFINGHDLMNLLFNSINLILKKESSDMKFNSIKELETILGISYISSDLFYKTDIFKQISNYLSDIGDSYIIKHG